MRRARTRRDGGDRRQPKEPCRSMHVRGWTISVPAGFTIAGTVPVYRSRRVPCAVRTVPVSRSRTGARHGPCRASSPFPSAPSGRPDAMSDAAATPFAPGSVRRALGRKRYRQDPPPQLKPELQVEPQHGSPTSPHTTHTLNQHVWLGSEHVNVQEPPEQKQRP
jgi:hypothetical protein